MPGLFSRVKEVERLERISAVLIKHGLGYVLSLLKIRKGAAKQRPPAPQALAATLEDLGGTFVKLGQFLSLRPDLVPREYGEAFERLQEQVAPFPSEKAKHIVQDQLRRPLLDIFDHFQDQPLAAASIGQVHRARLKSGKHVAVKVMRPGIKEQFMTDLLILYRLATLAEQHLKHDVFDPLLIIEEFRKYTEDELNYLGEAHALRTAAEHFKEVRRVKIPRPYDEWCTEQVLAMEFINGRSLRTSMRSLPAKQRKALAKEVAHVLFKMVFIDGFFHADLHPGNIILMQDGRIGIIDFGIVGRLDEDTREYLSLLFISLINEDMDGVVKAMARLHFFERSDRHESLKEDIARTLRPYYGVTVEKFDIAGMFSQSLEVARKHGMQVPTNMVLLGKAIITLKGVTEELDAGFDILSVAKPFMSELLQRKTSLKGIVDKASEQAIQLHSFITHLPSMTEEYFETASQVERDLHHIGYQIEAFSSGVERMFRQGLFLVILIILASLSLATWNQPPYFMGFSVVGVSTGFVGFVVFLAFIRTFLKNEREVGRR